jgi:hypothetical protein
MPALDFSQDCRQVVCHRPWAQAALHQGDSGF